MFSTLHLWGLHISAVCIKMRVMSGERKIMQQVHGHGPGKLGFAGSHGSQKHETGYWTLWVRQARPRPTRQHGKLAT